MDRFQYNLAGMFLWWPSTKIVQAVMIHQKTWPLGGRGLFSLYFYIENFKKSSRKKQLDRVQCNLAGMLLWWPSTKIVQACMICQKPWPPGARGLFFVYICIENFKILIVTYPMTDFNISWLECCFGKPLSRLYKQSWSVKKHGCHGVGLIFPIYLNRKL